MRADLVRWLEVNDTVLQTAGLWPMVGAFIANQRRMGLPPYEECHVC